MGAGPSQPLAVQFNYPEPERLQPQQPQDNRFARDHRHLSAQGAAIGVFADDDVKRVLGAPYDRVDVAISARPVCRPVGKGDRTAVHLNQAGDEVDRAVCGRVLDWPPAFGVSHRTEREPGFVHLQDSSAS